LVGWLAIVEEKNDLVATVPGSDEVGGRRNQRRKAKSAPQ